MVPSLAVPRQSDSVLTAARRAARASSAVDPLLGRGREIAVIERALADASRGEPRLVLVSGEAGIGKTRLLDEVARMAEHRQVPVARGAWPEAEGTPPYWAWQQVLQRADLFADAAASLTAAQRESIARLAPDVQWLRSGGGHGGATYESSEERFAAFQATARLIIAAAADRGVVALLDDLHWADAPSLRLLEHVAREVAHARLLLITAHRDGGHGSRHLRNTLAKLTRTADAVRLELRGLDRANCGACLTAVSGRRLSRATVQRTYERTGGNPFFVTECGRLLAARAATAVADDDAAAIPTSVRDVIVQRLERLRPATRLVLEALAVVGTAARPTLLASVIEEDAACVLAAVDEAAASGLLLADARDASRCRFAHDLVRDAIYAELPLARGVDLHRRVAERLERSLGVDDDVHVSEVADHLLQASAGGSDVQATRGAERAAAVAMSQLAFEDAARLYTAAAEAAASAGESQQVIAHLLVEAARALFHSGDLSHAAATCRQAASLARGVADIQVLAEAALVLQDVGDESVSALIAELCEEALAGLAAGRDTRLRSLLLAQRAAAAHYIGDYHMLDRLSCEALDSSEASRDEDAIVSALRARQLACSGPEGLAQRARIADRMIELGQRRNRPRDELWGHLWRIDNLVQEGRLHDAAVELDSIARLSDATAQPLARWHLERCRFALAHARGDFEVARQAMLQGNTVAAAAGRLALRRHHMQQALIAWMTGEPCEETIAALRQVADAEGQGVAVTQRVTSRAQLACLLLALERPAEAAAHYERLPSLDTEQVMPATRTAALAYRAVAAAGLGRRDDCQALHARMQPFADQFVSGGAGTVACHGSMECHLGACALVAGPVDAAVRHLDRAVDRNDAAGMRPWATISRYWLAMALQRRGREPDVARALVISADAARTAKSLGLRPTARRLAELTATLRSTTARGRVVTSREEEIATLVAQGLTNREIAAAFHLSVRTVDNHVQHILDKLQLRSRSQIASWVTSRPPR